MRFFTGAHVPKLRYRPRHRGGWFRGYNGPPPPPPHEGATDTSSPKADVTAAGEDPLLVKQIEIHEEVRAEAAILEQTKVANAAEELALKNELDAIFAPYAAGVERTYQRLFGRIETRWGLPVGTCHAAYVDAVRGQAEAEDFGRRVISEDLRPTVQFGAVLVA